MAPSALQPQWLGARPRCCLNNVDRQRRAGPAVDWTGDGNVDTQVPRCGLAQWSAPQLSRTFVAAIAGYRGAASRVLRSGLSAVPRSQLGVAPS